MNLDPDSGALGGIFFPVLLVQINPLKVGGAWNEVEFKFRATILKILEMGLRHQYIF